MLSCDHYLLPATLAEALDLLAGAAPGSQIVAGATDLLPWAREGRAGDVHVPTIIDVSRVSELDGYRIDNGRVRLGANVVYQQFLEDEELKRHLPCMPNCSVWFADDQIRQQATLAGNIVNASPAADGTPPIIAMNGEVEIATQTDSGPAYRTMPVAAFVQGPGKTALEPGEIVTAIICDSMLGYGGAFEKVGQRRSLVISAVCTACLVKVGDDGKTFADVRLVMGGIGPVPTRLDDVEAALIGRPLTAETIASVTDMASERINSRTRRDYRRDVVRGFITRALEDALDDIGIAVSNERDVLEAAHG